MDTLGTSQIWTFLDGKPDIVSGVSNTGIRKDAGHRVGSYLELAQKCAELQFRNRDHVLVFRGQANDHLNAQCNTSLKPSLLRGGPQKKNARPTPGVIAQRFNTLNMCESTLIKMYTQEGLLGRGRVRRHRIVRWSILQHYEVCATPLLDVTQSLRIAASFAKTNKALKSAEKSGDAYVYVLAVPNISGGITASAEAGVQIVRLSSVCPPNALRPHIQEGYLLGLFPDLTGPEDVANYQSAELDFGRRLLAKFRFDPNHFWQDRSFPPIADDALYPDHHDPMLRMVRDYFTTA